MTHSNHRRGDRESLENDWIVFTTDSRRHDPATLREYGRILIEHNPIHFSGRLETGERVRYIKGWDSSKDSGIHRSTSMEELREKPVMGGSAVYTSYGDVRAVLEDLKNADLGIAVVFTGLFDRVHQACKEVGTGPHTINMSAETYGRTKLLPEPKVLELTTMCGHHMISPYLVAHLANQVNRGRMTAKDAAVEMAKQCTCNFFNVERAEKLIQEYTP